MPNLYSTPIEVGPSSFSGRKALMDGKPAMIMFYADWCPHCNNSATTTMWKALAKERPAGVNIRAINCAADQNKNTCTEAGVSGFPTIMFAASGSGNLTKYEGARDPDALRTFIKMQKSQGGGARRRRSRRRKSTRRSRKRKSAKRSKRSKRSKRRRCRARTQDSNYCKRDATSGGMCWQHM